MKRVALPSETPGYREAVEQETVGRSTAFLVNRRRIEGFVVNPLTLRAYAELRLARSPLLPPFKTPTLDELILFLWRLQPDFTRGETPEKSAFIKRCAKLFVPPAKPLFQTKRALRKWDLASFDALARFAKTLHAAREFVCEQLADRPRGGGGSGPDIMSDECAIVARLGRHFHHFRGEDEILDLPLPRIFQYLRDCRLADHHAAVLAGHNVPDPVFLNRSDEVIGDYMAEMNRELSKN